MFKNPKKIQKFPDGTFIPKKARIASIMQLCLSFTIFFWILGKPYTEDYFLTKRHASIFEHLSKQNEYEFLNQSKKENLHNEYSLVKRNFELENYLIKSVVYFFNSSIYLIVLILLGIIIPIMLLKKNIYSLMIIWLFPCITTLYFFNFLYFSKNPAISFEERLFPSEKELIENYLKKPLSKNLLIQKKELEDGFKLYIKDKWSKNDLLTSAEFTFNIARFNALTQDILQKNNSKYNQGHIFPILLYLLWSYFFSTICYKSLRNLNYDLFNI